MLHRYIDISQSRTNNCNGNKSKDKKTHLVTGFFSISHLDSTHIIHLYHAIIYFLIFVDFQINRTSHNCTIKKEQFIL